MSLGFSPGKICFIITRLTTPKRTCNVNVTSEKRYKCYCNNFLKGLDLTSQLPGKQMVY